MTESTPYGATAPPATGRRPAAVAAAAAVVLLLGLVGALVTLTTGGEEAAGRWVAAVDTGRPGAARPTPNPAPTDPPGPTDPTGPAAAGGTVTLSGVGDVIMGTLPRSVPPNGGAGFFGPVKDALAADLVMGNLETPLTEDTGRVKCAMVTPTPGPGNPSPAPVKASGCHQFHLPPSYAEHLRDAGFDLMTIANNHTHDMGRAGLANTRAALDNVGIRHTGAPGQITYVEVKGMKIAVIGVAIYSWTQNLNDIAGSAALVRRAAGEADVVVVQMQGGAEGADKAHVRPGTETYFGENRGNLVKFSHAMVDAGADVIFGHGPHVMRGMEFYKGRLIAYSLGNFCGYKVLSANGWSGVGGVLKVTLRKDGSWVDGTLVPTRMLSGGYAKPDPQRKAIGFVAGLSRDDFGPAAAAIAADGSISPPA